MDKITELAEKYAEDHCETIQNVKEYNNYCDLANGFMAAMELQLPVLFAEWLRIAEWQDGHKLLFKHGKYNELYNYWFENIYQSNLRKEINLPDPDEERKKIH